MKNSKKSSRKPLSNLGKVIGKMREGKGMTQTELAEKTNTTQSAIARIEKGEQNLSTETLSKISRALNQEIVTIAPQGTVNFRIEGGHKLKGKIGVRTSKNGAIGVMCASLLNKGKTIIRNAPKIEEVFRIAEMLRSIGVKIVWENNDLTIIPPEKFNLDHGEYYRAPRTRSDIMLIGSLIHYMKDFKVNQPDGCKLGSRTVKPYMYALETLGVSIKTNSDNYHVSHKGLKKDREIVMYEAGDTVSETMLIASAKIPGKTVIRFASANYQVQDVCFFLEKLGVRVEGVGTSTMMVYGKENINVDVEYSLGEDPIEAMSLITAAILTKSSITIERCPIDFLGLELLKLEKMGFKYKTSKKYKSKNGKTNLVDISTFPSELKALDEKIHSQPYPGINIDNLPFFAVIGTQAEGQTFIHDWVYEERAIYYKELDKLRADTILADPHRFYVKGPTKLKATEIICPPALRPSVIIMLAMLAAEGTSILRNVYNINRGYEDLADRLNKLGAKIETFRDL